MSTAYSESNIWAPTGQQKRARDIPICSQKMLISPLRVTGEVGMGRDAATTVRLRNLISRIESQTESGGLHWEKQVGSAHRYARLNNNLLILGPATPLSDTRVPRYLFITPFDSPDCIEINSNDAELGADVIKLAQEVETASDNEPPTDPFAITDQLLERFES
jgi:hypothetical protein